MTLQKKNFTTVNFDCAEKIAIDITTKWLKVFTEHMTDKAILESPTTGECIEISELHRVLGILEGFNNNEIWEVKFKD